MSENVLILHSEMKQFTIHLALIFLRENRLKQYYIDALSLMRL